MTDDLDELEMHLEDSTEEYDLVSVQGVYPISREDAYIISTLHDIMSKLGVNGDLTNALREWKSIPDTKIRGMLNLVRKQIKTVDFVTIESHTIIIKSLFSIRKVDSYDTKGHKPVFKILLNETESPNVINGNTEIVFDSSYKRDVCSKKLERKLSEFTNIRFL